MGAFDQYNSEKLALKSVYYEGSDTLKAGYCLCYNQDSVLDMAGATVVEGTQIKGRFLRVEKPASANLPYFAGIVSEGSNGVTGPCWVTIVEANGHVFNVWTDSNVTTADSLHVKDASYLATTTAGANYVIGKCLETINRSGTNGVVMARLGTWTPSGVVAGSASQLSASLSDTNSSVGSLATGLSSAKVIYDSTGVLAASLVSSAKIVYDSTGLIANSASSTGVVNSSGVASVALSVSSAKVVFDSNDVLIKSSVSGVKSTMTSLEVKLAAVDSVGTAIAAAAGDSAASTVTSNMTRLATVLASLAAA
jgi:hypothetical protein